jgi:hypothetical protein
MQSAPEADNTGYPLPEASAMTDRFPLPSPANDGDCTADADFEEYLHSTGARDVCQLKQGEVNRATSYF